MRSTVCSVVVAGLLVLPVSCGSGGPSSGTLSQLERARAAVEALPAAYRYDLGQRCGENSVFGVYRLWVVDGAVAKARALDGRPTSTITPENLPTLADLLDAAQGAGPGAEVGLRLAED